MAENQKECREKAMSIITELEHIYGQLEILQSDEEHLLDSTAENLKEYRENTLYDEMFDHIERAKVSVNEAMEQMNGMVSWYAYSQI